MRQSGFTYLSVLFTAALIGMGLAGFGQVWDTVQRREREAELLFVGDQIRRAIEAYYANAPGGINRYPRELGDLLKDPRRNENQRYLRKIFHDPMTWSLQWGVVKAPDGGVAGVYSMAKDRPLKTSGFPVRYAAFENKTQYSDWQFVHLPGTIAATPRAQAAPVPQSK